MTCVNFLVHMQGTLMIMNGVVFAGPPVRDALGVSAEHHR